MAGQPHIIRADASQGNVHRGQEVGGIWAILLWPTIGSHAAPGAAIGHDNDRLQL
jgi:hypothetical protein